MGRQGKAIWARVFSWPGLLKSRFWPIEGWSSLWVAGKGPYPKRKGCEAEQGWSLSWKGLKPDVSAQLLICVWLFCDPMDCSPQASLSMQFSRQEYWCGLSFPAPGDLPTPGVEPSSLTSAALADGFFLTTVTPGKPYQASEGSSLGHVEHCSADSRWDETVVPASIASCYVGMLAPLSSPIQELMHHTYMSTTCVNTLSAA